MNADATELELTNGCMPNAVVGGRNRLGGKFEVELFDARVNLFPNLYGLVVDHPAVFADKNLRQVVHMFPADGVREYIAEGLNEVVQ